MLKMEGAMKMKKLFVLSTVVAFSLCAAAEKPRFDPRDMFGIELDSLLPFDQESHSGDTNYVSASVKGRDDRVWLRNFRGFSPREVRVDKLGGVERITATRGEDIAQTNLPTLFRAMGRYFGGFSGIAPAAESATNRVWRGATSDGVAYAIEAYQKFTSPNGMATVWMDLRSDVSHGNAQQREARLRKQLDARKMAAEKMMREKSYQGVWGYSDRQLFLMLCFMKGGLGIVQYQYGTYPFYWTADERGNVEGVLAVGEGLLSKMKARFDPARNEFDVRIDYPDDKDFLAQLAEMHGEDVADEDDGSSKADGEGAGRVMVKCTVPALTCKNREHKIREFIEMSFHKDNIEMPLTKTVDKRLSAAAFDPPAKPSSTISVSSFKRLPDFAKMSGDASWMLRGGGACRMRGKPCANGGATLLVTIGELSRSDDNAPSYAWLELAVPEMKDASEFESRVPHGLSDEQTRKIAEAAEAAGFVVEGKSLELNMFWHYRREDILSITVSADKLGQIRPFIASAFEGTIKFPARLETYDAGEGIEK